MLRNHCQVKSFNDVSLALADLHDIYTGQTSWWRNLVDPTIVYDPLALFEGMAKGILDSPVNSVSRHFWRISLPLIP